MKKLLFSVAFLTTVVLFSLPCSYASAFPNAGIDVFNSIGLMAFTPQGSPVTFVTPFLTQRSSTQVGRSDPFIIGSGNPPIATDATGLPSTPNPANFVFPGPMPPFTVDFPLPDTGRRAINTEILSLDLITQFTEPTYFPGVHTLEVLVGLPFQQWVQGPGAGSGIVFQPSFGQVVSNDFAANPANDLTIDTDSFFDVFAVVLLDGVPYFNVNPFPLYHGCVQSLPPDPSLDANCRALIVGPGGYEETGGMLMTGSGNVIMQNDISHQSFMSSAAGQRVADMAMRKLTEGQLIPAIQIVQLQNIPEPGTLVLLAAGLFGFVLEGRRSKLRWK